MDSWRTLMHWVLQYFIIYTGEGCIYIKKSIAKINCLQKDEAHEIGI